MITRGLISRGGGVLTLVTYNGPPAPPPTPRTVPIGGPSTVYNYAVDETASFWVDEGGANAVPVYSDGTNWKIG
jgi:hypothetical protein